MKTFLLVYLLLTAGCSFHWKNSQGDFQHSGFVYYKQTQTARAQTFELQTFGLQFRFFPEDSGLSLGYRKYISLKPPLENQVDKDIVARGVFMTTETISKNAAMLFRKQLGLEFGSGLLINGMTLGYDKSLIIGDSPNQVSMIKKIDFYENEPVLTYVYQSSGE